MLAAQVGPDHQRRLDLRPDRGNARHLGRHYETAKAALIGFTQPGRRLGAAGVTRQRHRPGRVHDRPQPPLVPRGPEVHKAVESTDADGPAGRARRDRPAGRVPGQRGVALHDRGTVTIDGGYTLW